MALKIRLRQQGRHNQPFYRIVVMDSRSPRDGSYVEMLGWYNPRATKDEELVQMNSDRVQHWISKGAQLTEPAVHLVRRVAPQVVQSMTQRSVAKRAKARAKRRAPTA